MFELINSSLKYCFYVLTNMGSWAKPSIKKITELPFANCLYQRVFDMKTVILLRHRHITQAQAQAHTQKVYEMIVCCLICPLQLTCPFIPHEPLLCGLVLE